MIVMCLVGEQVRMFNANRERFKQYVYPFNSVILPRNRGYGVTSILEHTALRIATVAVGTGGVEDFRARTGILCKCRQRKQRQGQQCRQALYRSAEQRMPLFQTER
jgi:hypothetical protein